MQMKRTVPAVRSRNQISIAHTDILYMHKETNAHILPPPQSRDRKAERGLILCHDSPPVCVGCLPLSLLFCHCLLSQVAISLLLISCRLTQQFFSPFFSHCLSITAIHSLLSKSSSPFSFSSSLSFAYLCSHAPVI